MSDFREVAVWLWSRILVRKSEIMMRAILILVGLGTLVAMELKAPPRTRKTVNEPLAQSTVGLSASRDTLTKADRLEIPYVQKAVVHAQAR